MENESSETAQEQVQRIKGRFAPGFSGNPGGAPKGKRSALMEIEAAIEEYEKTEGVSYWYAATILAMALAKKGNATLLGKLMDKFLPSKLEAEMNARPIVMMPTIKKMMPDGTWEPLEFNIGDSKKSEEKHGA